MYYCKKCRGEVDERYPYCFECNILYCRKCSKVLEDDEEYCSYCGASAKPPAKDPVKAKRLLILSIFLYATIITIAAVAGYFTLRSINN